MPAPKLTASEIWRIVTLGAAASNDQGNRKMRGADATDSLLRSTSWAAEKLFKQHDNCTSVLFVAEYADGSRQRLERYCNNAPATVSDADLLTELAKDVALDFAETNVVRFVCAYLCRRLITLRPIDPDSPTKPTTTKRQGVIIELHDGNEPVGVFREILRSSLDDLVGAGEERGRDLDI